jgi:hypothetical protein
MNTPITDEQFTALLEHIDPEVLHSFALAIYAAAWADGANEQPLHTLEPEIGRFVQQVASEHGARYYAERQRAQRGTASQGYPEWFLRLGED